MATLTPSFSLLKPTTPADDGLWGPMMNSNFEAIDAALAAETAARLAAQAVGVAHFGAVGDGVTDDTAAIQAAVNALAATGGVITFDARPYRIAGTVTVTASTILFQGAGKQDFPGARTTARPLYGTWLIHESTTGPAFQFTGFNSRGSGMRDLAFYQTGHAEPGPGWWPTVHDYTVRSAGSSGGFSLERVHFHNCYLGALLDFVSRPYLVDVTGQPFLEGIKLINVYDVGSARGIHFWAYWSQDVNVLNWQQANGACLVMPSPSALMISDVFGICYKIVVWLALDITNGTHNCQIGHVYADFCATAIQLDAANTRLKVDSIFHLGQVFGSSPATAPAGAAVLNATNSGCQIEIDKLESNLARLSAINLTGAGVRLYIGALKGQNWNQDNVAGTPLINAGTNGGNGVLLGSEPYYSGGNGGPVYSGGPGIASSIHEPVQQNHGNTTGPAVNYMRFNSAVAGGRVTGFAYGADTNLNLVFIGKGTGYVSLADAVTGDATRVDMLRPMRLKSYTVATLPSAVTHFYAMVYVTNESGGGTPAFSDGTSWRRVADRAVVT